MIDRAKASARVAVEAPPAHVAIIMDGNRRWATERGLPALEGHRRGAEVLREVAGAASDARIRYLTVFAFSEENWHRDAGEVRLLMDLVRTFARSQARELRHRNVRVHLLGRRDRLPALTTAALQELVEGTSPCTGLQLNLAIDYGARTELCDAVRALAVDVANGALAAAAVDEDTVARYLYTAGMPDPDLLIRTGGELRVSNFLLYQIAYAELWSTQTYWPDFDAAAFRAALDAFSLRQRRFGR
jgi:undecaprenyl diphosphate synthase